MTTRSPSKCISEELVAEGYSGDGSAFAKRLGEKEGGEIVGRYCGLGVALNNLTSGNLTGDGGRVGIVVTDKEADSGSGSAGKGAGRGNGVVRESAVGGATPSEKAADGIVVSVRLGTVTGIACGNGATLDDDNSARFAVGLDSANLGAG